MHVGVGYSDHEDTELAGTQAVREALRQAGRSDPCDLVLLFSTASHEAYYLRSVVTTALGSKPMVVGGGAVGIITNSEYGHSGDQVGIACIWLDGSTYDIFARGGLVNNEDEIGRLLGVDMGRRGVTRATPSILMYDGINRLYGDVRLNLGTPLLQGLERGLGFLPDTMVGAGLQGDFDSSPTKQWIGDDIDDQHAVVLTLSDNVRMDSVVMHGCKPAGKTYTVTKADRQTILEVNGKPALPFIQSQLTPRLPAEDFPFFMIFGVNRAPGEPFAEENYANRLCLDIDAERNGIVMFESDMAAGTEFQIMYRSMDLDYMQPAVDRLFARLDGRRPVLALYIDCAGRAQGVTADEDEAVVLQRAVANRVPLLGFHTGVEIAPIRGQPRTLDWTGVFCLLSVSNKY